MKIELSEDYEEKIMSGINERRKNAQKMRKKVLSIVIVFACLFGITSMGYCQFKKNEYTNYFISDSENQLIEDEYQYFDGLGIKLNFINYAEDSIVIGINLKNDNIIAKEISIEKIEICDLDTKNTLCYEDTNLKNGEFMNCYTRYEENDVVMYMIHIISKDIKDVKNIKVGIENIKVYDDKIINLNWYKIIKKEKE